MNENGGNAIGVQFACQSLSHRNAKIAVVLATIITNQNISQQLVSSLPTRPKKTFSFSPFSS